MNVHIEHNVLICNLSASRQHSKKLTNILRGKYDSSMLGERQVETVEAECDSAPDEFIRAGEEWL